LRKNVLTTGEVARICSVAPRTVSKWFDSGQLCGYRIPGSKDRRIPLEQLVRFMRMHGMPLDALDEGAKRVLLVDGDREFGEKLGQALRESAGFKVQVAENSFEAGAIAVQLKPNVIVVDADLPGLTPKTLSRFVKTISELQETSLIGMARELSGARREALRQDGFDSSISKPFDIGALVECIDGVLYSMPESVGIPTRSPSAAPR
jgi:excisionase family DNA binding protein